MINEINSIKAQSKDSKMKYTPVLLKRQLSTIKRLLNFPDVRHCELKLNDDEVELICCYKDRILIKITINQNGIISQAIFIVNENITYTKSRIDEDGKEYALTPQKIYNFANEFLSYRNDVINYHHLMNQINLTLDNPSMYIPLIIQNYKRAFLYEFE